MVDITDFGRVLTAMANDLQNRLEGPLLRDDRDVRAVLWSIRHMLTVGASKCAEIAKEQLDDAPCAEMSEPEWINHRVNPPKPEMYVEVKFFDGSTTAGYAKSFFCLNIEGYRLIDRSEQTG